ncbi:SDR family NAD(P)-dependent oxidoreductase [Sphaerisporangium dianthi]|uniref:SDR family NAD(P)-dependent oxidoreductase n=1 Tax=Sphaerisporangium dianthi TaxID=1436120 RepID=A0ABV9CPS9_9ACTN
MTRRQEDVAEWLITRVAEMLSVEPATLSPDVPFTHLGLSSMQAVELSDDLQRWTGLTISPTLAFDHPTIAAAALHIAEATAPAPEAERAPASTPAPAEVAERMPIAIVGIGARLPGGGGAEGYWKVLREGVDAVGEIPANRWDGDALYDPDPDTPGRMNTRWGGFLDDVEGFDADFFAISSREAARMDPQQRVMLEVAWEALEDAGIAPSGLSGSLTGVFVGAATFDHGAGLLSSGVEAEAYDGTGSALSVIANRLSYCLNLRGPSIVADTACSSSLVAVHLACQALRSGEAELALAGGVNVITSPRIALSFSKGRLMAPDGRCKAFDHRANGYVRSEGAGMVVLKPLARALADGDRVYAVIKGGAVNQDGRTNGLAAPSRPAQEAVLRAAYAAAGVDPAGVDYVEAHGTGTAVGDPIEVGALASVLGRGRPAGRPLRIGSAKSNIGHAEAAAGVAGLIKTALSLHHGELPPTVHFEKPNPLLGLDRLPIVVQSEAGPWPERPSGPAVAGVSSFGFGGTNAHIVLTAAPSALPPGSTEATGTTGTSRHTGTTGSAPSDGTATSDGTVTPDAAAVHLFPVSARSEAALRRRAAAWAETARRHEGDPGWPARAAAAAALRSDHHRYRAAVVASDAGELAEAMTALAEGRRAPGVSGPHAAGHRSQRPTLVFPGQGAQWEGMGRRLAETVPAFRDAIRRCDAAMSRVLGRDLWDDETGLMATGTAHVPPALFAYQVALAEAWRSFGMDPVAVIGHSMGEIAAAHVAGALSLEDAARLVCVRSALLTEISGRGGLALVELEAGEAAKTIEGREHELSVAAVNGPRATVLSGAPAALDEVITSLEARGVFARRIAVDFAAHSPEVEPLQPRLRAALEGIEPRTAATMIYSTVAGEPVAGTDLGPAYWERNVREPVLFASTLSRLIADGHESFIEIAPHPVLSRSVAELADHLGNQVTVVSSARRDEDEARALLQAVGEMYTRGAAVRWPAVHQGAAHVDLPPHGWEHQNFPLLRAGARPAAAPRGTPWRGGLLGERVRVGAEPGLRLWPLPLDLDGAPELADHVADGVPLVPGAYWLVAAAQAAGAGPVALEDVGFAQPCPIGGTAGTADADLQLTLRRAGQGRSVFLITSDRGAGPVVHAEGVALEDGGQAPPYPAVEELTGRCGAAAEAGALYDRLRESGLDYGPRFRGLTDLSVGRGEALGRLRLPAGLDVDCAPLHPALLDAAFHTVAAAAGDRLRGGVLPLPAGASRVWARGHSGALRDGWAHAVVRSFGPRELIADVTVLDEEGRTVWSVSGLRLALISRRTSEEGRLYSVRWQPVSVGSAERVRGGRLVIAGRGGLGRELGDRLAAAGEPCLVAVEGPATAPGERSMDSCSYEDLLAEAEAMGGGLHGVVDARAVAAGAPAIDTLHDCASATVGLARAMARRAWPRDPARLWLLTSCTDAPAGAVVSGLGMVIANEHPELACSLIDVDADGLDGLVAALRAPRTPARLVVRDGVLLEPRFVALAAGGGGAPIRAQADYLVTGGLGSLGLQVARWLAGRGARRLVLLGRGEPGPEALRAIEELRETGAEVRVERADVADAARLREVLDGLPALAGVFHLAGVLEDALIDTLGEDVLRRALAAKAVGAWNLHSLTLNRPIEHFVMFSSLAGLFGSPGQGAYAAGNTFLDALAVLRAGRGLPAQSIDWGTWAGSGLAVEAGGVARLATRGMPPLRPDVAIELLDQAVDGGYPHLAAAAFDWAEFGRAGLGPSLLGLLEGFVSTDGAGSASVRGAVRDAVVAAGGAGERLDILRRFLLEQVSTVLGRSEKGLDTSVPLQELGFDSLMAMELRTRLEAGLDIRLSATVVYTYPTVEALAAGLLDRLGVVPGAPVQAAPGTPVQAAPGTPAEQDGDLAGLDDDELAALLSQELDLHGGTQ